MIYSMILSMSITHLNDSHSLRHLPVRIIHTIQQYNKIKIKFENNSNLLTPVLSLIYACYFINFVPFFHISSSYSDIDYHSNSTAALISYSLIYRSSFQMEGGWCYRLRYIVDRSYTCTFMFPHCGLYVQEFSLVIA